MARPKLFVYFDMDGVLVEFNTEDSVKKPFLVPGSHYFRNQLPDTKAVDLMRCLSEFPKVKTLVLTRLTNPLDQVLIQEHAEDKKRWCLDHNLTSDFDQDFDPNSPDTPFICLHGVDHKAGVLDALSDTPMAEKKRHILIDDDIVNLIAWTKAGGTAYQYIQPFRYVPKLSEDKHVLDYDMTVPEMAYRIMKHMPGTKTP